MPSTSSAPAVRLLSDPSSEPLVTLQLGVEAEAAEGFGPPLRRLSGPAQENWFGGGPVQDLAAEPGLRLRLAPELLFGEWRLPLPQTRDMERAAYLAYRRLMALLQERGYPHLLRVWNYFHDVTAGEGDEERYRRFCVGRYEALYSPGFERSLPAATVIGSFTPGFRLSFIAARRPGTPVENPRQVSAYSYPRDYGPRAPTFARATLFDRTLLVSGTASVVGHATRHPFQAAAQLDETLANLRALLAHARTHHLHASDGDLQAVALRLYVRDLQQAEALRAQALRQLGEVPLVVLHGEICRRDLEVEIEGVFQVS